MIAFEQKLFVKCLTLNVRVDIQNFYFVSEYLYTMIYTFTEKTSIKNQLDKIR